MRSIYTSAPLSTSYQLVKFVKHTVPDSGYAVQSVFESTSTAAYANYICNASAAGAVEYDVHRRRNIIWVAGLPVGFEFRDGVLVRPQDAVKVVLSSETARIHAYPQASSDFSLARCANCGTLIVR
jgi:hypothetical protein